jgi:hypothetical protein
VVGKDNPPDLADLVPSGALSFPEESVENVAPTHAQTKDVPKEKTCLPGEPLPCIMFFIFCALVTHFLFV